MVSFSTLVQEYSPLLQYSSNWTAGTGSSDNLISSYSAVGFVATQLAGETVSFTFNGTGVQIYGAKRDNHGQYQVRIDGTDNPPQNGFASPSQFQAVLFSTSSLQPGLHTVTLTNLEDKFVDIDYFTWQNTIGEGGEDLIVNTIDDSSSDFQYSPGWSSSNPSDFGTFLGGTGHETSASDSYFTYTFTGNSVSLYGPIGPNYSPYTVQVDGGTVSHYNASNVNFIPQVILYYADGLGPGTHSLKVMYQPSTVGQTFAIDYASTSSTQSLGGVVLSAATSSSNGISGGSVAGIVFGILISLGLLFGGLYYFLIWKRRREAMGIRKLESNLLAGQEGYSENYVAQPGRAYSIRVPSRHASYMSSVPPPLPAGPRSVAPSEHSSGMEESYSPTNSYGSHTQLIQRSGSSTSSNSTSPRGSSVGQFSNVKGRRVHLPAAAGQSLDQVPAQELAARRMVVEGRPQDFGSIAKTKGYVPAVEDQREPHPPPNYLQATETY